MQSALTNGGCQQSNTAGAAVVIGLLAPLAALGLLVVILVAIVTSGPQRIGVYKPIDEADRIDDWLYLPEVLYAFMLIMVVSAGAGPYSLDALILGLIDKRGA
jgi:putative oxidoreductase